MAKEAYYFSHDYGARNDPKLQKVLMKLGQEGKGVYWDIVEMLFEEGGYLLLSECDSYAFALRTNTDCINSLVNDFGLFQKNDVFFWSDSVNRRLVEREQKSEKARNSANNRWKNANASKKNANASEINASAVTHLCDGNAIKERKGKEKKEIKDTVDKSTMQDDIVDRVVKLLNETTGKDFKVNSSSTKTLIIARLKDGFTYEDFERVIIFKCKEWLNRPDMVSYLRPKTLFNNSNFESYLNSSPTKVVNITPLYATAQPLQNNNW